MATAKITGRAERESKVLKNLKAKLIDQPFYMNDYITSISHMAIRSQDKYLGHVIRYIEYLKISEAIDTAEPENFKKIKPSQIMRYINTVSEGSDYKNVTKFALKSFFKFLVMDGYIDRNPIDNVNSARKEPTNEIVYLTDKEIQHIINNLKNPYGNAQSLKNRKKYKNQNLLLFYLGITTGLRVSSLVEINLEDIDLENMLINTVQKGNRIHTAYYSKEVARTMKNWLEDRQKILDKEGVESNVLFLDTKNRRIHPAYVDEMLIWASAGLNKHVTPHVMRKTCGTRLYNQSGDLGLTAQILGHKNIQVTAEHYAKVDPKRERRAAEILSKMTFKNEQEEGGDD